MDASANQTVHSTGPEHDERLKALGVATLGWLVCAGVLAMFERVPATGGSIDARGISVHLGHLLVPLLAGVLCQSSASSLSAGSHLRHAAGLWAVWTMLALGAAIVPHQLSLHEPWSVVDLLMQQVGIVLGIALGWLGAPALTLTLNSMLRPCETLTRGVIAFLTVAIILVPLSPEVSLLNLVDGWRISSPRGYLNALPNQAYLALKSLILWVPLGMLYALAQKQVQLRGWTIAGSLAFLIIGLPLLYGTLRVQDVLEILSAYWGICLGLWLGTEVYRSVPEREPDSQTAPVIPSETNRGAPKSEARSGATAGQLPRRIAAVLLLLSVGAWSWFFPRWGLPVLCGLGLYALLLSRYRHAWLLVVPAALPLLNLAPATGRFYFDEFDLLMVTTVAMAWWHGAGPLPRPTLSRLIAISLALFGLSFAVSLVIGLLPLSPLDANAFTNYWSHYNSLRTAKGFLWALSILALVRWTLPSEAGLFTRLFVPGMWLGLAGVIAMGLWERWLFAGLLDLSARYRITATFSSMHTGGSEIETYLVTAIPFVWLAFGKERPAIVWLAGMVLLILGAYLTALTVARAGVLALGVAFCILLLGAWRTVKRRAQGKGTTMFAAIVLLVGGAVLLLGMSGGYLQQRLARSEEDWAVRLKHWQEALAMRDQVWSTTMFGMGLGRFPETYLYRSRALSRPSTYRFMDEDGNRFLRLSGGETLYMAQRVSVAENRRYTLNLRLRSRDTNARLGVTLCEKHLLNSRLCQWQVVALPADGSWHTQSITIDSGPVGAGNWLTGRPVELSLYSETQGARVDVDEVQLGDETGTKLMQNGDFSAGGDYWFFKTHSHLPWHIKNLWVEVLFEQGWLGLISFVLLLGAVVSHLARGLWHGDMNAGVLLAATSGFLTVGLFGSLFDTPRIATLFFSMVVLAGTVVQVTHGSLQRNPTRAA